MLACGGTGRPTRKKWSGAAGSGGAVASCGSFTRAGVTVGAFNGTPVLVGPGVAEGARVDIDCSDGKFRFADTYHDKTVTPDDDLRENFAIGDVPAGWCQLSVDFRSGTVKKLVTVNDGGLTFVVLRPK